MNRRAIVDACAGPLLSAMYRTHLGDLSRRLIELISAISLGDLCIRDHLGTDARFDRRVRYPAESRHRAWTRQFMHQLVPVEHAAQLIIIIIIISYSNQNHNINNRDFMHQLVPVEHAAHLMMMRAIR